MFEVGGNLRPITPQVIPPNPGGGETSLPARGSGQEMVGQGLAYMFGYDYNSLYDYDRLVQEQKRADQYAADQAMYKQRRDEMMAERERQLKIYYDQIQRYYDETNKLRSNPVTENSLSSGTGGSLGV